MPSTKVNPNQPRLENVVIYGARLLFRNLAGRANPPYNDEGERSFAVVLEPDMAERMAEEGYNVKELRVREEGDVPDKIVRVKVNYNSQRPPRIVVISRDTRTVMEPDDLGPLDYADIANVDLVINPSRWNMNGSTGVSAYLKSMYITLAVDELEARYEDAQVPPSTTSSSTANDAGRTDIEDAIDLSEFDTPLALEED